MTVAPLATLGGSTLPRACGLDPYCSPIRLWLQLTGRETVEPNEAMWWGTQDEATIIARLGMLGWNVTPGRELRDPERPWLTGHTDGHLDDDPGSPVEVKSLAHSGEAVLPAHQAQLLTYMHLSGADVGLLARRIGHRLDVQTIKREQHYIDLMLGMGEDFLRYVWRDEQPPVTGHVDDRAALLVLHPDGVVGKRKRETRDVKAARQELVRLMEAEKARKARMEHLRAVVTDHLGDATELLSRTDETVATWRNQTTRRVNTDRLKGEFPDVYEQVREPQTTRVLRLT